MSFNPPDNLSTLAFLAIVLAVLAMIVWGARSAAVRSGEDAARVTRATVLLLLAWVALTSIPPATGILQAKPFPGLPIFFAVVLAGAITFALSRHGTRLAQHLSLGALVGFQAFRLPLELVLHAWAEQGTIPGTMTWTGRNYDVATGVLALLAAPLAQRNPIWARVFQWIGAALLLNVLHVVVMSSPLPFAWNVEPRLVLAAFSPFHLIGTVCVAGALAGHIVLFRALNTKTRAREILS